jgi:hypothetical protein
VSEYLVDLMEKIRDNNMKAEDLVKIIDTLVEKKLNASVKQLIKEEVYSEVNKVMGKMIVEMIKESKQPSTNSQVESPINTRNPKLNSILAETARSSRPQPRRSTLVDLMDGGFDKIGGGLEPAYTSTGNKTILSEPKTNIDGSNMSFVKSMVTEGAVIDQQQSVLGTDAVPDVLKGVFNKNFSKVIKKMDEQKKNGSPGLINPSSVFSNNV